MDVVKQFKGHSGCRVFLMRRGDLFFVRKLSASAEYNQRLIEQVVKQKRIASFIEVPAVTDEGYHNDLYFFDMAFINGSDFANFALHRSISWIHDFVSTIGDLLGRFAESREGDLEEEVIRRKVKSVVENVRSHPFFADYSEELEFPLSIISDHDWKGVPRTQCHGDMTLENMLFTKDGRIVFIDVLDGDLESFWFDISKLIYDLEYNWSLRQIFFSVPVGPEARLLRLLSSYAADELRASIKARFLQPECTLRAMMCLQAARVLPYTQDHDTFARLTKALVRMSDEGSV